MNGPVDVLAEMERASSRLFDAGLHGYLSLDKARAAVAELIEAAIPAAADDDYGMDANEIQRLIAALARVKGGAA